MQGSVRRRRHAGDDGHDPVQVEHPGVLHSKGVETTLVDGQPLPRLSVKKSVGGVSDDMRASGSHRPNFKTETSDSNGASSSHNPWPQERQKLRGGRGQNEER